ncbi:MAG: hypothetical protein WBA57_08050 [Elainellaceae cyanobacterium]
MIRHSIQSSLVVLLLFGCGSPSDKLDAGTPSESDSGAIATLEPADSDAASTDIASATTPAPVADTTVVPGEKFGAVTLNTSRQDLEELFGVDVLTDEAVDVGEGMTEAATLVALEDGYAFTIVWEDDSRTAPFEIRDIGEGWTMPEGIQVGTSFSELQSSLGEFELYGLGWDYGGTVVLDNTTLDAYQDHLILRLQPDAQAQTAQPGAMEALMGDSLYASDNPNFGKLNMSVYEIIVRLGS